MDWLKRSLVAAGIAAYFTVPAALVRLALVRNAVEVALLAGRVPGGSGSRERGA